MKITANGNTYNSIRNAIDKEAKITAVNMQLIEKMDYLNANRISDDSVAKIEYFDENINMFTKDTKDSSIISVLVEQILAHKYDSVSETDIEKLTKNAIMLPTEYFQENLYINNIILKDKKYKDLSILNILYPKYQLTYYSGPERKNLLYYPCWGFIQCDTINYVLKNTKTDENTVIFPPCEMLATQNHIDTAKGKVLTLGLKIGYFVYLAGLKDDVSEITVVEEDEQIIGFFNENILPQFDEKTRNKIKVLKYNPIEYLKFLPDGEFDLCFVNLWAKHTDTKHYCQLMKIHNKFKKMKMDYYKEIRVVGELYEVVALNIYFALMKRQGGIDKDLSLVEHFSDSFDIYKLQIVEEVFKDYKIKELKDLMNLYSFKFLQEKFNGIEVDLD